MKDNFIRGMVRAVCPPRNFLTSLVVVLSTLLLLFVGTQLRAADLKVTKDLRLWLKADAGVTLFPNEEGVAVCADQSKELIAGSPDDQFARMEGNIAELMIFNEALPVVQRKQVVGFLAARHGLDDRTDARSSPLSDASATNLGLSWAMSSP